MSSTVPEEACDFYRAEVFGQGEGVRGRMEQCISGRGRPGHTRRRAGKGRSRPSPFPARRPQTRCGTSRRGVGDTCVAEVGRWGSNGLGSGRSPGRGRAVVFFALHERLQRFSRSKKGRRPAPSRRAQSCDGTGLKIPHNRASSAERQPASCDAHGRGRHDWAGAGGRPMGVRARAVRPPGMGDGRKWRRNRAAAPSQARS